MPGPGPFIYLGLFIYFGDLFIWVFRSYWPGACGQRPGSEGPGEQRNARIHVGLRQDIIRI